MNERSMSAPLTPIVRREPVVAGSLPRWDHLPPERRRELTATLAALLIKRLPTLQPGEGRNE